MLEGLALTVCCLGLFPLLLPLTLFCLFEGPLRRERLLLSDLLLLPLAAQRDRVLHLCHAVPCCLLGLECAGGRCESQAADSKREP